METTGDGPLRGGIDLGGTKIEGVVLADDGTIVERRRVPTERDRGYDHILDRVTALVRELLPLVPGCRAIGIGTPGAVSRGGLMKNSNTTCLNGRPVHADLEARIGLPIRMENDANCFALAEAVAGAGRGHELVFGVILGTGVGGGIVVHGRALDGPNGIAGEWGHNPLSGDEPFQPSCYCGRKGCIETFLSGPGLAADHHRHTGTRLSAEAIGIGSTAGDAACEATLQRYEARLARALAGVVNILDPDVVVLGGGLSNLSRLYANVPRLWGEHVFSDRVATRLLRNRHGDSSGVRGAAALW